MMKKTIYIHIGFGKTGTTAIQSFLSKSKNALLEHDFLYPETGLEGDVHHLLVPLDAERMSEDTQLLYGQLVQEILDSPANNVIISSECFTFAIPTYIEDIKKKLAGYDVKIVFYVRSQKALIESAFLQWQKVGDNYQGCVEKFFETHKSSFNFVKRITPWAASFGEDCIIARLYENKLIGNDVCRDITSLLGLEGLKSVTGGEENVSLRPEFSALVNIIDSAGIGKEDRIKVINELLRLSVCFNSCKKENLIKADLENEIAMFYKVSNREFASKYLEPEHAAYLCHSETS